MNVKCGGRSPVTSGISSPSIGPSLSPDKIFPALSISGKRKGFNQWLILDYFMNSVNIVASYFVVSYLVGRQATMMPRRRKISTSPRRMKSSHRPSICTTSLLPLYNRLFSGCDLQERTSFYRRFLHRFPPFPIFLSATE